MLIHELSPPLATYIYYNMKNNSKKAKFNNWVSSQYKKIYQEQNFSGKFEKKMDEKIRVIVIYILKDVLTYDKTPKQKKELLFQHFLTIIKEIELQRKLDVVKDKKFETKETLKERERILSNFPKTKKRNCFYLTNRWLTLKKEVKNLYKCGCMRCGKSDIEIHVDHIFPRSIYPKLQYSIHNLQILCKNCNEEKSNINTIDYRTKEQKELCQKKYP